jgi:hypothetical protein
MHKNNNNRTQKKEKQQEQTRLITAHAERRMKKFCFILWCIVKKTHFVSHFLRKRNKSSKFFQTEINIGQIIGIAYGICAL